MANLTSQPTVGKITTSVALLFTLGIAMTGGLAIKTLPNTAYISASTHRTTPPVTAENRANHAQAKLEEEIRQRFNQGVLMLHAKQYEHALTAFHRVLQLSPEMPEAHVNTGYAMMGLGRYSVARDFFEGAIALRSDQLNAYYGLAEALEAMNDLPGAIGAMRTYIHLSPDSDKFKRKAEAAVWEWEAKIKVGQPSATPAR